MVTDQIGDGSELAIGEWVELPDSPRKTEEYAHREYQRSDGGSIRHHVVSLSERQFAFTMRDRPEHRLMFDVAVPDAPDDTHPPIRKWRFGVDADAETITPEAYVNVWDGTMVTNPACPCELKRALEVASGYTVTE